MIAGLPQAPSQYNPLLNPRAALARRNEVLQAMKQQGDISASEFSDAVGQGLGLDPGNKFNRIRQPYIFDLVKQELEDRYGVNTVQNGGLKVFTTIQPQLQQAAQSAVDSCSVCYPDGGPASALASVDPTNGQIVALASTQRYSLSSQFNFAAHAQRQPGSSFKVYGPGRLPSADRLPECTRPGGRGRIRLQSGPDAALQSRATRATRLR
jgi:penicillin-binding protein 1A